MAAAVSAGSGHHHGKSVLAVTKTHTREIHIFLQWHGVHTICLNLELVGHELGHAFGLDHDWRSNNYIMSYGPGKNQLSKCAAEWLDVHRAFNPAKRVINTPFRAKIHPPRFESSPNTIRLDFTVTDLDGIHQVQLLGSTKLKFGYQGVIACKGVKRKIK